MRRGSCDPAEWTGAHTATCRVRPFTRRGRSCLLMLVRQWRGFRPHPPRLLTETVRLDALVRINRQRAMTAGAFRTQPHTRLDPSLKAYIDDVPLTRVQDIASMLGKLLRAICQPWRCRAKDIHDAGDSV